MHWDEIAETPNDWPEQYLFFSRGIEPLVAEGRAVGGPKGVLVLVLGSSTPRWVFCMEFKVGRREKGEKGISQWAAFCPPLRKLSGSPRPQFH